METAKEIDFLELQDQNTDEEFKSGSERRQHQNLPSMRKLDSYEHGQEPGEELLYQSIANDRYFKMNVGGIGDDHVPFNVRIRVRAGFTSKSEILLNLLFIG